MLCGRETLPKLQEFRDDLGHSSRRHESDVSESVSRVLPLSFARSVNALGLDVALHFAPHRFPLARS
jgi:hypothetical protein